LCYQTRKGLWIFSKISSSQHYPYSFPFFQKYYKHPIYSPFFPPSTKINHFFLFLEGCGNKYFKIRIKNYVRKIEPQMIWIHSLKRRRRNDVKEDPNLVANGRFQCLVALGRFQCLVANGRKRKITFSALPTFPLINFT
jgi:hypothetical protein